MGEPRFGLYIYQREPVPVLRERWRRAEALGFDAIWNVDTVVEPDRPRHPMLDGPATLAAMATETSRVRIGTLVTSLYFRQPVTAARAATTVDHLSNGRVEVALGIGDPSAGPRAAGTPDWSPAERFERFAEFVELTDLLLRQEVTTYEGTHYRCDEAEMNPPPVQRPRPPITIAAHGPRMLRLAASSATVPGDGWNQWGGYDIETEADFWRVTRERTRLFDELCLELDRDPRLIRHSLVVFYLLRPWASRGAFEEVAGRAHESGIDELVLYWPGHWRDDAKEERVMEEVAADVIPRLRQGAEQTAATQSAPGEASPS